MLKPPRGKKPLSHSGSIVPLPLRPDSSHTTAAIRHDPPIADTSSSRHDTSFLAEDVTRNAITARTP